MAEPTAQFQGCQFGVCDRENGTWTDPPHTSGFSCQLLFFCSSSVIHGWINKRFDETILKDSVIKIE
jgi:hypothetical protein